MSAALPAGGSIQIVGGRTVDGEAYELTIRHGTVATGPAEETLDAAGAYVVPGLIDLQVNGAVGLDLTERPDALWDVAAALPRLGVTAFAPTIVTSSPEARSHALAVLRSGPPDGWRGAVPLGLHLEGPMLAPSRKGAHTESWLRPPSLELVAGWSRAEGVLIVTLAPELPGALEVVRTLTERGVVVSLGHTDAPTPAITAAVAAGARMATHLGNAMPPMQAREPGLVGAALGGDLLVAGLIADGVHLDPLTLRSMWRALGPERTLLVTDATAALGAPDGPIRLGDQHAYLADGAVRLADGTLAGSAASLPHCVHTLVEVTGCPLGQAVGACTATPADLIGDTTRGRLRPGSRGDVTLLDERYDVVATVVAGEIVYRRDH